LQICGIDFAYLESRFHLIVIFQINLELPNFFGNGEAALRIESASVTKSTDAGGSFVRATWALFYFGPPSLHQLNPGRITKTLTDVCASNK
jgi:hypothetical protein